MRFSSTQTLHTAILVSQASQFIFGGAVSVLTYQIRFIEKVGLDVFYFLVLAAGDILLELPHVAAAV